MQRRCFCRIGVVIFAALLTEHFIARKQNISIKKGCKMGKNLLFFVIIFALSTTMALAQFEITIDAEKDEWYNNLTGPDDGYIFIPSRAYTDNGGAPDGDEDISALLWVAWDEQFLYAYEEVTDDYVVLPSATPWENDCFELKFDPDPSAEAATGVFALRMSALDSADVLEDVYAGVDNLYPEGNPDAVTNVRENYARKETDTGYVVECKVPWEAIAFGDRGPVAAQVGEVFGLAVNNIDNDGSGIESTISWAAAMLDAVWNEPPLHGTIEFLEDHKLKFIAENWFSGTVNDSAQVWYTPPQTAVNEHPGNMTPFNYTLSQNYPNPFNPSTNIEFSLLEQTQVKLVVHDVRGHLVATLVNQVKAPGHYTVAFNGLGLGNGIYFYTLYYGDKSLTRKMTLVK